MPKCYMTFLKDFPHQSLFLLLVMEGICLCSVGAFWHWEGGVCMRLWFPVLVSFMLRMPNCRTCGVEN